MNAVVDPFEKKYRAHIVLLGKELEFASGIRAFAAGALMHEEEYGNADALFADCEQMIGAHLFESYGDPRDTSPSDFSLGRGCPFPSLEAYLTVRELYGRGWLANAAIRYAASFGSVRLRDDPMGNAREMVQRARARFEDAVRNAAADSLKRSLERSKAYAVANEWRREQLRALTA